MPLGKYQCQMKTDAEKVRFNKKSVENLDFHFLRTAADAGAGPHHCQHSQRNDGK